MANKFERNFEEYMEQEQPEEQAFEQEKPELDLPYSEEDDSREYLMTILDYLENELANARQTPFGGKKMIDAQLCIDVIADIRANLPLAVQYCEQMLQDRERILRAAEQTAANKLASADVRANAALDDAQERADRILSDAQVHADNIVKDAEVRARAMIDQNTIKIEAQKQAQEIINEARMEAQERRLQAADYCDKLLRDAEDTLSAAFDDVRRNRQALAANRIEARQ